ncbi:MAG: hypothetical protein JSS81_02130 [Acidobacteria bacterium]|nr:hypothetical protein [Acidobacteriota bacterium]
MKKTGVILFVFVLVAGVFAQQDQNPKNKDNKDKPAVIQTKTMTPDEAAKAAVAAHGGDKFKNSKTLIVRGTADISASPTQTVPSTFVMIFAGDKYRYEITNPFQPFKQVYDGQQTSSSLANFTLPPINRLGLPLLQRFDQKGYSVSALPETAKKKNGFRITSPEGYYTDFFLDEKTSEVKSYESAYDFNGRTVTTSVEIDKLREVDGVKVPEKYAQRFELGFATFYADFKAKDILVNSEVADDVFTIEK